MPQEPSDKGEGGQGHGTDPCVAAIVAPDERDGMLFGIDASDALILQGDSIGVAG